MDADDFRDYMLSFLFLRYLSDNYEAASKKELGKDYPKLEGDGPRVDGPRVPLAIWYANNPDDVLFINAAGHFEKGKRQNRLTEANIAKIIGTYQFRREEDRYSKGIGMERIAGEGYNLNISRYISTAVGEVGIDLEATNAGLVEIEGEIEKAMNKHNAF